MDGRVDGLMIATLTLRESVDICRCVSLLQADGWVWWTASPADALPCIVVCLDTTDNHLSRVDRMPILESQLVQLTSALIEAWAPTGTRLQESPHRPDVLRYLVDRLATFVLESGVPEGALRIARERHDMEAVVRGDSCR